MNFDITDHRSSPGGYHWGPGDILPDTDLNEDLPAHTPRSTLSEIRDLFQEMESKVDAALVDISNKLSQVESRVKAIEDKSLTSSPSSSSGESSTDCKRKRRSPPELQFQIRTVHSSFRDENKFHCHDRIDSEHNRSVVENIIKEVGTDSFSSKQVREGCRIYRKTLHERERVKSDEDRKKMRIRSRQQRLFDRRKKSVIKKKSKQVKRLWEGITPEMMTEEETGAENNYIRHQQSWRSSKFNRLMDKLDEEKGKSLARQRELGDIVERATPQGAKVWMISSVSASNANEDLSEVDEASASEDNIINSN